MKKEGERSPQISKEMCVCCVANEKSYFQCSQKEDEEFCRFYFYRRTDFCGFWAAAFDKWCAGLCNKTYNFVITRNLCEPMFLLFSDRKTQGKTFSDLLVTLLLWQWVCALLPKSCNLSHTCSTIIYYCITIKPVKILFAVVI